MNLKMECHKCNFYFLLYVECIFDLSKKIEVLGHYSELDK